MIWRHGDCGMAMVMVILATLVWGRVGSGNEWWTCG